MMLYINLLCFFSRSKSYKWLIDTRSSMLYRQHDKNELGVNRGLKSFIKRVKIVLNGTAINQSRKIAIFLEIDKKPEIKNLLFSNKKSYLYMLINFNHCRRRFLDQIYFLFACIFLFFLK